MERRLSLLRMHWDLEPVHRVWERRRPRRRIASGAIAGTDAGAPRSPESLHAILGVQWDPELKAFPLTRPSDTLSPIGGYLFSAVSEYSWLWWRLSRCDNP